MTRSTRSVLDPENQRSIEDISEIRLLPAHEFPTSESAIEDFRIRWRQQFDARREPESVYMQVSEYMACRYRILATAVF